MKVPKAESTCLELLSQGIDLPDQNDDNTQMKLLAISANGNFMAVAWLGASMSTIRIVAWNDAQARWVTDSLEFMVTRKSASDDSHSDFSENGHAFAIALTTEIRVYEFDASQRKWRLSYESPDIIHQPSAIVISGNGSIVAWRVEGTIHVIHWDSNAWMPRGTIADGGFGHLTLSVDGSILACGSALYQHYFDGDESTWKERTREPILTDTGSPETFAVSVLRDRSQVVIENKHNLEVWECQFDTWEWQQRGSLSFDRSILEHEMMVRIAEDTLAVSFHSNDDPDQHLVFQVYHWDPKNNQCGWSQVGETVHGIHAATEEQWVDIHLSGDGNRIATTIRQQGPEVFSVKDSNKCTPFPPGDTDFPSEEPFYSATCSSQTLGSTEDTTERNNPRVLLLMLVAFLGGMFVKHILGRSLQRGRGSPNIDYSYRDQEMAVMRGGKEDEPTTRDQVEIS